MHLQQHRPAVEGKAAQIPSCCISHPLICQAAALAASSSDLRIATGVGENAKMTDANETPGKDIS